MINPNDTDELTAEDIELTESARRENVALGQIIEALAPLPKRKRAQVLLAVAVRFDGVMSREQLHRLVEVAAGLPTARY